MLDSYFTNCVRLYIANVKVINKENKKGESRNCKCCTVYNCTYIKVRDWIILKRGGFESPAINNHILYLFRPNMCFTASRLREDIEDDLSELTSEAVPDEVRKWLASTFAKQEQVLETIVRDSL